MKNKLVKTGISFFLGVQALSASAIEFQDAIHASSYFFDSKTEVRNSSHESRYESQGHNVTYSHFLKSVDAENLPVAEAAFYNWTSSITAGGGIYDYDYDGSYFDGDPFLNAGVVGEFYVPRARMYFSGAYTYTGDEYGENVTELSVGVTPIKGLRLSTDWNTDKDYIENIMVKYVQPFKTGQAVNVQYDYESADSDGFVNGYYLAELDFYFSPSFSLGVFQQKGADPGVSLQVVFGGRVVLGLGYQRSKDTTSNYKDRSEYFSFNVSSFF